MTDTRLTPSEQQALMQAMANNFGPCTCQPPNKLCSGHQFLGEKDLIINRVIRLTYVRRDLARWQHGEQEAVLNGAVPPSRESPPSGDDSTVLPW